MLDGKGRENRSEGRRSGTKVEERRPGEQVKLMGGKKGQTAREEIGARTRSEGKRRQGGPKGRVRSTERMGREGNMYQKGR